MMFNVVRLEELLCYILPILQNVQFHGGLCFFLRFSTENKSTE
jgi:hypothetical protein